MKGDMEPPPMPRERVGVKCAAWLARKRRYCGMHVWKPKKETEASAREDDPASRFCAQHCWMPPAAAAAGANAAGGGDRPQLQREQQHQQVEECPHCKTTIRAGKRYRKHLQRCPVLMRVEEGTRQQYFSADINAGSDLDLSDGDDGDDMRDGHRRGIRVPSWDDPLTTWCAFHDHLETVVRQMDLKTPPLEERFASPPLPLPEGRIPRKHALQRAAIVGQLQRAVPDFRGAHTQQRGGERDIRNVDGHSDLCVVEIGAGKAGLAYHLARVCKAALRAGKVVSSGPAEHPAAAAAAATTNADAMTSDVKQKSTTYAQQRKLHLHLVLVDNRGFSNKVDRYVPEGDDVTRWKTSTARCRVDAKDVRLDALPGVRGTNKRVIVTAKHLCGAATDMALRAIVGALKRRIKCQAEVSSSRPNMEGAAAAAAAPRTHRIKRARTEGNEIDQTTINRPDGSKAATAAAVLDGQQQAIRIAAVAIVPCCHHVCAWKTYVNRPFLRKWAGCTDEAAFSRFCRISSWATTYCRAVSMEVASNGKASWLDSGSGRGGGDGTAPPSTDAPELVDGSSTDHFAGTAAQIAVGTGKCIELLPDWRKLRIGWLCKHLLEEGRAAYLRKAMTDSTYAESGVTSSSAACGARELDIPLGFDVKRLRYCKEELTPENSLLLAVPRTQHEM